MPPRRKPAQQSVVNPVDVYRSNQSEVMAEAESKRKVLLLELEALNREVLFQDRIIMGCVAALDATRSNEGETE